jgi:hypothetical protein
MELDIDNVRKWFVRSATETEERAGRVGPTEIDRPASPTRAIGMSDKPKNELGPIRSTQRDETGRFLTGNTGGPGRRKGARNRLSEDFVAALADDFEKHGSAVIRIVRTKRPADYLKLVASLVPRRVDLDRDDDSSALVPLRPIMTAAEWEERFVIRGDK